MANAKNKKVAPKNGASPEKSTSKPRVSPEVIKAISKEAVEHNTAKKLGKAASLTSIDPYSKKPRNESDVIDLSSMPNIENVKLVKIRFDDNYIIASERIQLATAEYGITNYLAWSIKRVRLGENDADKVADKNGQMNDRFAFSGRLSTITELHEALVSLARGSQTESIIPWEEATALEKDQYGICDISTACRPVYSDKVYGFGPFRVYMDNVTYSNGTQHEVTYKAVSLTKWRDERSRSRSKHPDSKFFILHIPARRLNHLILAIELIMHECQIKSKVPFCRGIIRHKRPASESGDTDLESDVDWNEDTSKIKKKKKKKSPPPEESESDESDFEYDVGEDEDDDDDDEEEDEPTPTVEEEEAAADDGEPTASDLDFIDDGPPEPHRKSKKRKREEVEVHEIDGDDEDEEDEEPAALPPRRAVKKKAAALEAPEANAPPAKKKRKAADLTKNKKLTAGSKKAK